MSKLSFRARALDAAKPLPIYRNKDLPDLTDCVSINRAVPQMPSGMEKEEESEHHLQRAISAQQVFREKKDSMVIPVPEARSNITYYERLYRGDFRLPKQLVHVQPLGLDLQELPDYDMDSEDEILLSRINRKMELKPAQFEVMMDWLEKASSKQLVTLQEAKLLLKEDELLLKSVYDYWLRKRRVCRAPSLTPRVKQETSSNNSDAYVAFRRRTEKMQTRKNRKSDEASYEKMLKLRRDFSKTMSILEMILKREKSKHQLLRLTADLVEKRYEVGDFSGEILKEVAGPLKEKPIYSAPISNRHKILESKSKPHKSKPESRLDCVRSHKRPRLQISRADLTQYDFLSSGDECGPPSPESEPDDENDPDGNFAFRRKAGCHYHAPRPEQTEQEQTQRRPLLALSVPRRCLAVAGRRVGRGGRVVLDRASSDLNHALRPLDPELFYGSSGCGVHELPSLAQILTDIRSSRWKLYRPLREKTTTTTSAAPQIPAKKVAGIGFTEEQFHSHQQQLALMHRLQQNPTPPPHAHQHQPKVVRSRCVSKTLDSASAHFAASAVVSAEIRPRNGVLHQSGFRSARGEAGPVSAVSPAALKLASTPKVIARENQEPDRRALKVAMEVT